MTFLTPSLTFITTTLIFHISHLTLSTLFVIQNQPIWILTLFVLLLCLSTSFFIGEDEFFGSDDKRAKRRKRSDGAEPKMRRRREKDLRGGVGTYKPKMKLLSMELVGADGMYYTIKKKVKMVDPLQPTYVRIPSQVPLPRSWSRTIVPYTGFNSTSLPNCGYTYIETDIVGFDLKSLGRNFQGVIIDPPWINSDSPFFTSIGASNLPNGGTFLDLKAQKGI